MPQHAHQRSPSCCHRQCCRASLRRFSVTQSVQPQSVQPTVDTVANSDTVGRPHHSRAYTSQANSAPSRMYTSANDGQMWGKSVAPCIGASCIGYFLAHNTLIR
eukprot:5928235-Pyramimonas_sp.AAC.1